MNKFLKNWKTTTAGVVIAVLAGLRYTGNLPPEMYEILMGLLATFGFIHAADSNTPPPPTPPLAPAS